MLKPFTRSLHARSGKGELAKFYTGKVVVDGLVMLAGHVELAMA